MCKTKGYLLTHLLTYPVENLYDGKRIIGLRRLCEDVGSAGSGMIDVQQGAREGLVRNAVLANKRAH